MQEGRGGKGGGKNWGKEFMHTGTKRMQQQVQQLNAMLLQSHSNHQGISVAAGELLLANLIKIIEMKSSQQAGFKMTLEGKNTFNVHAHEFLGS